MTPSSTATTDIVVVGAGMSGLSAALAAAEAGCKVAVFETDVVPGGSARWSSGRIWTLADYQSFRRLVPLGDDRLQRMLCETIAASLDWLGASVGSLVPQAAGKTGFGRSMTLGTVGERTAYFAAFASRCREAGVKFFHGATLSSFQRTASGHFEAGFQSGSATTRIVAPCVVLASGGYQGDRKMLADHLGPEADRLMIRSNPNSKGDGVRAGLALNGVLSRGTSAFYGKSMPLGAELLEPLEYKRFTFDIARHTIAVNLDGVRFVDEAAGTSGEIIPNASIYQPGGGRYFLILDGTQTAALQSDALHDLAVRSGRSISDLLLQAATPHELLTLMSEKWGVDRHGLAQTLAEVAHALASGHGQDMKPPRHSLPAPLNMPPLTALACRPAITIPFGGLAVDDTMAVLDAERKPLSGLFAAGADAGGVYYGAYAGGLAWALTSGRAAGLNAAAVLKKADRSPDAALSFATL